MVACGVMRRVLERRLDRLASLVSNGNGVAAHPSTTADPALTTR
jgi:hypothetical protein